jgi:hypothetical protein
MWHSYNLQDVDFYELFPTLENNIHIADDGDDVRVDDDAVDDIVDDDNVNDR